MVTVVSHFLQLDIRLAPGADTGLSAIDGITQLTSPTIRLALADIASSLAVGNDVTVKFGSVEKFHTQLTAADLARGYVEFTFEDAATQGAKSLAVVIRDNVKAVDIASGFMAFTIDTTAPTKPTVNTIATNDIINAAEAAAGVQLSGAAEVGTKVVVKAGTYRSGYLFEAERYLNTPAPKTLEMHFLPQHEIFKTIEAAGCCCLEVREDGMVGEEEKMLSNTFLIQKHV